MLTFFPVKKCNIYYFILVNSFKNSTLSNYFVVKPPPVFFTLHYLWIATKSKYLCYQIIPLRGQVYLSSTHRIV
jgi:hypothetical protein